MKRQNLPQSLRKTKKNTITRGPKTVEYIGAPLKKVKAKRFRLNVRSRHGSHDVLKKAGIKLPFRTAIRFGSSWMGDGKQRVECNTVLAVRTSANKRLMKVAFQNAQVKTADWAEHNQLTQLIQRAEFPIVAKHIHGSRGTGNYLLKSQAALDQWKQGKNMANYIFEKFYDYNREYRLHVTKNGCFYTCRKVLKNDTPEDKRWFRNDSNSNWLVETNPSFDKPVNWDAIVAESVKALKAVGLDIGAIDVRVQSAKTKKGTQRPAPDFIILETNSAPSFGKITAEKYSEVIPQLLTEKYNEVH